MPPEAVRPGKLLLVRVVVASAGVPTDDEIVAGEVPCSVEKLVLPLCACAAKVHVVAVNAAARMKEVILVMKMSLFS